MITDEILDAIYPPTPTRPIDFADKIAVEVMGDWLPNMSDNRTVRELIAEGVRRGYALGFGAAS